MPSRNSMIDDSRLRVFEAAASEKSFTKAARILGISQSAVSQSVAELEKRLGVPLFERNRGTVILTSAGRELREYARKIIYWYDAATEAFKAGTAADAGPVRIVSGHDLVSSVLPEILRPYTGAGSRYRFDIVSAADVLSSRHGADMYLWSRVCGDSGASSGMKTAAVSSICAVACPADRNAYGGVYDLSDIKADRLAVWSGVTLPHDCSSKVSFRSDVPGAIVSTVLATGDTVGILPLYCVKKELADKTLVRLPITDLPGPLEICLEVDAGFRDSAFQTAVSSRLRDLFLK